MTISPLDLVLLGAAGTLAAFGALLKRHVPVTLLLGVPLGYLTSTVWGPRVATFFGNWSYVDGQPPLQPLTEVAGGQVAVLVLVTILVGSFAKLGGRRGRYGVSEVVIASLLVVVLLAVLSLTFLEPAAREAWFARSSTLQMLFEGRAWVLALPVFHLVIFGLLGSSDER